MEKVRNDNEQTMERRMIQKLLQENKMKDMALEKATNLIQLLTLELQGERQAKTKEIQQIQNRLRIDYELQLRDMAKKMRQIQVQLSKASTFSTECDNREKNQMEGLLKSLQINKKTSINKKFSQVSFESPKKPSQVMQGFDKEFLQVQFEELQEWKSDMIQQMNALLREEIQELQESQLSRKHTQYDFESVFTAVPEGNAENRILQMHQIIQLQRRIINELRSYTEGLQSGFQGFILKLQSIYAQKSFTLDSALAEVIEQGLSNAKQYILQSRRKDKISNLELQFENRELKQIVEQMIELIRIEKQQKESFYTY